ncbi:Mobile element protein [Nostoc sphaeroides CCNUC1]|uniref:Mobile element protein n=1 Tax=Nostoc sphaeroides CCNUC1 TaxID=2653204 RepID=A0A5P8WGP2_9NOSO|nr:Mobile element protein [Nostoc sphaeroides CCNUC1]
MLFFIAREKLFLFFIVRWSINFRLNPKKYEQVILTICGLVRLRIRALILPLEISAMSLG